MFGIGMPELILILAIALIVIGPKKLPDLAKSLGRAMREFKKATNEFKESIQIDEDMTDVKKAFDGLGKDIKASVSPAKPAGTDRPSESQPAEDEKAPGKEGAPQTAPEDKIENVKNAFDELKKTEATGDKKQPQEGSAKDA